MNGGGAGHAKQWATVCRALLVIVLLACAPLASNQAVGDDSVSMGDLYSWVTAERDVRIDRSIKYGPDARHRLDIYRASKLAEKTPIVVFIYGGAWTEGDRSTYGFVGSAFASRGFTTVVPNYRLHPAVKFPAFVEDAALAYAWVSQNLGSRCGEQRPIILMGHSAGAHIAALLAFDRRYLTKSAPRAAPPAAFIGLAGPYAFDPTTWPTTKAIFETTASRPDAARPVAFARAGAPPSLLMHGLDDDVVKPWNSRDLTQALLNKGNDVQLMELPGIGHVGIVLAISQPLRWRAAVLPAATAFIEKHSWPPIASHLSKAC